MGGRGKTSTAKIRNGAGEATSSLSGESAFTHQGAREKEMGCVGETDGKDPQMARGGRSGSQGDPTSMGEPKRACGPTLRPQPHPVVPLDGLLAALESVKLPWRLWMRGRRQLEMMK